MNLNLIYVFLISSSSSSLAKMTEFFEFAALEENIYDYGYHNEWSVYPFLEKGKLILQFSPMINIKALLLRKNKI